VDQYLPWVVKPGGRKYWLVLGGHLCLLPSRSSKSGDLALTLLVTQVLADHHDPAVTTDHLALLADLLDARLNLHVF
jgi:hypothetical protein